MLSHCYTWPDAHLELYMIKLEKKEGKKRCHDDKFRVCFSGRTVYLFTVFCCRVTIFLRTNQLYFELIENFSFQPCSNLMSKRILFIHMCVAYSAACCRMCYVLPAETVLLAAICAGINRTAMNNRD